MCYSFKSPAKEWQESGELVCSQAYFVVSGEYAPSVESDQWL